MLFQLFLIVVIIFTLYFLYTDVMNKIYTNKPFAEGFVSDPECINLYGYDNLMEAWSGKTIEGFKEGARTRSTSYWNLRGHSHSYSGSTGPQGRTGNTGATGATGATGGKGKKGDKGNQGEKGDKGDKGEKGSDGTGLNLKTFAIGTNYNPGDYVFQNDSMWIAKTSFKASENPKVGAQWTEFRPPPGKDGEPGPKGDKGEKGDTGESGSKGDKGDKGELGDQGKQGETGSVGNDGIPGTAGTGLQLKTFKIGDTYNKGDYVFQKSSKGDGQSMWIASGFTNLYNGLFNKREPFTAEEKPKDAEGRWVEFQAPTGPPGPPGENGKDGKDGEAGADGKDGTDGTDGADGEDGADGIDGKDGIAGKDGMAGGNVSTPAPTASSTVTVPAWVPPPPTVVPPPPPQTQPRYTLKMEYKENDYKLPNNYLVRPGKGICKNGCKVPQYDNEKCSNEMIGGKAYRNCPWIGEGSINDSMCKGCGSVLLPKNCHGYARTRAGLFNNKTVNNLLSGSKFNKEQTNPNINYKNIGFEFMNELSMARNFTLPFISKEDLTTIGKVVNKYQLDEMSNISGKKELVDIINDVLNTGKLPTTGKIPNTLNSNKYEYELRNTLNTKGDYKDKMRSEEIVKGLMGSNEYYKFLPKNAENSSDNRLGGSSKLYNKVSEVNNQSAYTNKYRPVDPRKKPKPYDSIWELFSQ